ncbi:MAG TPA: SpoIIE family protein phosphatase, partial [Terriglobales bacterium]|nr:SpoIIE family protein phosphatase [Terriglobales bacterium]
MPAPLNSQVDAHRIQTLSRRETNTSRLLPQTAPILKTLECTGRCLQARSVGGDYYDFIELGRDQVALVLADVSGKGVHAALLVANLQAHLRSLSGLTSGAAGLMKPVDLVETLQQVNRILWK